MSYLPAGVRGAVKVWRVKLSGTLVRSYLQGVERMMGGSLGKTLGQMLRERALKFALGEKFQALISG